MQKNVLETLNFLKLELSKAQDEAKTIAEMNAYFKMEQKIDAAASNCAQDLFYAQKKEAAPGATSAESSNAEETNKSSISSVEQICENVKPNSKATTWTPEKIEQLKMLAYQDVPNKDIADELNVPLTAVYAKRSQLGITVDKVLARTEAQSHE